MCLFVLEPSMAFIPWLIWSVCMSVCVSVCLLVCLSVCLSVCTTDVGEFDVFRLYNDTGLSLRPKSKSRYKISFD